MRTLFEIIEAAKSGEQTTQEELLFAVLALDSLSTFDAMDIRRPAEMGGENSVAYLRYSEHHRRWHTALNASPEVWLGDNVPSNPDYQKLRKVALALLDKVVKKQGEAN